MIAKTYSAIPYGYDGRIVEVEGDMSRGLPIFNIVGMANKTISEARERVRSAFANSDFKFPDKKVTINLAPAELTKDGTHLDLPIALTVLVLSGQLLAKDTANRLFVGELSLNGQIRPVRGIVNIVEAAKSFGCSEIFLPVGNYSQASLIPGIKIFGVPDLNSLFLHLKGEKPLPIPDAQKFVVKNNNTDTKAPALDHIRGQDTAKRALSIAVAGHHNILLSGPPGSGKTLLARAAANLLPDLSLEERIAATKLNSLATLTENVVVNRPFRSPHHTASLTSIIGGGSQATPGEISLAHLGVLFLDELPEYPRSVLESLRQPLEDKTVSISRARSKAVYPADFMLIATMNPCPCGFANDPHHECTCTPSQLSKYQKKISGPLFDRFDIYINVPKVDNAELLKPATNSTAQHTVVKNTITEALNRQRTRYGRNNFFNSSLSSHQVSTLLKIDSRAQKLLASASDKLAFSARAYFKILKVAQTIADLEGANSITEPHLAEALSLRQRLFQR